MCIMLVISSEKICNFAESCLLDGLFLPGRLHCSNSCGRNWTLMLVLILQLSCQYIPLFFVWSIQQNEKSSTNYLSGTFTGDGQDLSRQCATILQRGRNFTNSW